MASVRRDIETSLEDGNSALSDTFLEDRPKAIWRFTNFTLQKQHHQELLENYTNAPNKKTTLLYQEVHSARPLR